MLRSHEAEHHGVIAVAFADWHINHESADARDEGSQITARTKLGISAQLMQRCVQAINTNAVMDTNVNNIIELSFKTYSL